MRIGITGYKGFIGWHLRCYLKTLDEQITEIRTAGRETFSEQNLLEQFVTDLDIIIHLAGVNRASKEELLSGNTQPAERLIKALEAVNNKTTLLFASSTHASAEAIANGTAYGSGKAQANKLFVNWANTSGSRYINMIIPHVFGEYGQPHYNSGIATFCHQIVKGEELTVNKDGQLELIHVQDLVELFYQYANDSNVSGDIRVEGKKITVGEVVQQLQDFHEEYVINFTLPDLNKSFERNLFNTLRGALPHDSRLTSPKLHVDERGWLVETVKAGSGGQCFVSSTKAGITRGNHFHRRKVERFLVLQGQAQIQLRKLFTNEIISYKLDGSTPSYVDIPTLFTHNITNTGYKDLTTLFWSDEFYDPDQPDTYPEEV